MLLNFELLFVNNLDFWPSEPERVCPFAVTPHRLKICSFWWQLCLIKYFERNSPSSDANVFFASEVLQVCHDFLHSRCWCKQLPILRNCELQHDTHDYCSNPGILTDIQSTYIYTKTTYIDVQTRHMLLELHGAR